MLKQIRAEVERTARRFKVSRSFVIATALAEAFGIEGARGLARQQGGQP